MFNRIDFVGNKTHYCIRGVQFLLSAATVPRGINTRPQICLMPSFASYWSHYSDREHYYLNKFVWSPSKLCYCNV